MPKAIIQPPHPDRQAREALGLTQGAMARLLRVRRSTIYRWDHGGGPSSYRQVLDLLTVLRELSPDHYQAYLQQTRNP